MQRLIQSRIANEREQSQTQARLHLLSCVDSRQLAHCEERGWGRDVKLPSLFASRISNALDVHWHADNDCKIYVGLGPTVAFLGEVNNATYS